jgi:hypothetical protein
VVGIVKWISRDLGYPFRSMCTGRGAAAVSIFSLGSTHFSAFNRVFFNQSTGMSWGNKMVPGW